MNPVIPEGKILIRFDGLCVLCSRSVRMILNADKKKKFVFQSLQDSSDADRFNTIIVIDQNSIYTYFDAILKIGSELGGIYKSVAIFRLIPRAWRHSLYLLVARNRFRWFGKRQICYVPTHDEKERFI